MPWIRFDKNFDWQPMPRVFIAYKAGMTENVTTRCADAARAAGAGKAVNPRRGATRKATKPNDG